MLHTAHNCKPLPKCRTRRCVTSPRRDCALSKWWITQLTGGVRGELLRAPRPTHHDLLRYCSNFSKPPDPYSIDTHAWNKSIMHDVLKRFQPTAGTAAQEDPLNFCKHARCTPVTERCALTLTCEFGSTQMTSYHDDACMRYGTAIKRVHIMSTCLAASCRRRQLASPLG